LIRVQCELARLPPDDDRRWELEGEENALMNVHERKWRIADLGADGARWRGEFRRGFVEMVSMSAATFLAHAEALFRQAPLRHLQLNEVSHVVPQLVQCPQMTRLE